jgi:tetratricopeptide (TPR) repeat protein
MRVDVTKVTADLAQFPEEHTREFEEAAVSFLNTADGDVEGALRTVLSTLEHDETLRYSAFFTLSTLLRRRGHFSALLALVEDYESAFKQRGTLHHMKAMALTGRAEPHDLALAITSCNVAREILPNHTGVLHSFAILKITEFEHRIPMSECISQDADILAAQEIDNILSKVLLERPKYAKFHSSLARLESLRGNHANAQKFLSRAMELEDPSSRDFNLRIVNYNQILSRIVMRESLATVASETKQATQAAHAAQESVQAFINQMQARYLELLGIFAAIIGIVLSGVQVSTSMNFADGARLMLMVTGAILIIFSAISAVLQRPLSYMLTLASSGALVIVAAFVYGLFA